MVQERKQKCDLDNRSKLPVIIWIELRTLRSGSKEKLYRGKEEKY